jgi:hypothetical protein
VIIFTFSFIIIIIIIIISSSSSSSFSSSCSSSSSSNSSSSSSSNSNSSSSIGTSSSSSSCCCCCCTLSNAGWLTINFLKEDVGSALPEVLIRILHWQKPHNRTAPTKATGAVPLWFGLPASREAACCQLRTLFQAWPGKGCVIFSPDNKGITFVRNVGRISTKLHDVTCQKAGWRHGFCCDRR